ncbi:MAG: deoxyribose-phosphate aldolase [Chloroflexi bacterium GWC2_70_10]|nr:MAG: deoxyribose-phosphate aldolase [Chloroflexi bacterium GWC2_70_10]
MDVQAAPRTLPTVPELASIIDHAVLKPTQTERDVVEACTIARREHVATVCVKPFYVPDCARLLKDSGVGTSTVIGFPHGGQAPEVKVSTALTALRDGATELDMVINIGALIERDYATIEKEIASVVGVGHASEAAVKVILETAYLDDAQKAIAAQIAMAAGADFVKTSTGFGPEGATVEDVRLLRSIVGPSMGVKASGGIRTLDDALAMIDAGASRLGTSSTGSILDELRQRRGEA